MSKYLMDAKVINLSELFQGTSDDNYLPKEAIFEIPNNQRAYEWEKEQLIDFVDDISLASKSDQDYFMGNIILDIQFKESKYYFNIQDGQQRITTIILFYAALYKFLRNLIKVYPNSEFPTEKLANEYKNKVNEIIKVSKLIIINRNENEVKLISGIFNDFFTELIKFSLNDDSLFNYGEDIFSMETSGDVYTQCEITFFETSNLKYVENNILNSYLHFMNLFISSWKYKTDKTNGDFAISTHNIFNSQEGIDIYSFSKFLYEKVIFNTLKLKKEYTDKRFKIFETINARGKQLNESDKIKNYILSVLYESDTDSVKTGLKYWGEIIINTDTKLEEFIRDIVILETNIEKKSAKDVVMKNVYDTFVKTFNRNIDFLKMLKRWVKFSKFYNEIISPKILITSGADYYNTRQVLSKEFLVSRPFQLLIYNSITDESNRKKILNNLVILYILTIILQVNYTYRTASRVKAKLLNLIKDHDLLSFNKKEVDIFLECIKDFVHELAKKTTVKEGQDYYIKKVLVEKLKGLSAQNNDKITKYILIKYENSMRDVSINMSINEEKTYHLEHILSKKPRNDSPEYIAVSSKEFNLILDSLGNYLIISSDTNIRCKNKPIQLKLDYYEREKNEIRLVKQFFEYIETNQFKGENIKNDIKRRTSFMAKAIADSKIFELE